jgi:hypothetical protein
MPRLGGWCHRLLGIYYVTHLAPRLEGCIRHGTQRTRSDLSGNLGRFLGEVTCLTIFSGNSSEKGVLEFTEQNCPS